MQRMQRKFGTYLPRSADEAQVATMLHEFEEADKMLAKVLRLQLSLSCRKADLI